MIGNASALPLKQQDASLGHAKERIMQQPGI
jgi:hypothetical protein